MSDTSGDPKKMVTTEQEDPPPDIDGRQDDYDRAADRVMAALNTLGRVVAEGHLERPARVRESA